MNRFSLIFALLVASSFAVHPTRAGDGPSSPGGDSTKTPGTAANKSKARTTVSLVKSRFDEPVRFLALFLEKAQPAPKGQQGLQILYATVPHPVETNLGSAFDHNVEALQVGLQEAGYLFDSSWIPWNTHEPREDFDDDEKEKNAAVQEDDFPGILLFRKNGVMGAGESYSKGIVVFLLSEKPTQGIAVSQLETAWEILKKKPLLGLISSKRLHSPGPVRILGPTFSGSFPSLVKVVGLLHGNDPHAQIVIRSGGTTGGGAAKAALQELVSEYKDISIDFGSAHYDYAYWDEIAESTLVRMGIQTDEIAFMSEDESSFGWYTKDLLNRAKHTGWRIPFPRDISGLRAGYAQQGVFDPYSPAQPWKRFLHLKGDDPKGGDTIRSFGGTGTTETQEAILFGISEFLKSHSIRAVVISATNEEDRLFLTQFLHVNNPGVRVVIIGDSRIFMRGSTAQFRGDLMVDDFPMLPRLHDWTVSGKIAHPDASKKNEDSTTSEVDDHTAILFDDDVAQGTYFSAIDLFGEPKHSGDPKCPDAQYKWYPEDSEPLWGGLGDHNQKPPMYVVALGSNATWPVAEMRPDLPKTSPNPFLYNMPFTLFSRNLAQGAKQQVPTVYPLLHVGRYWKILTAFVLALIFLYCVAIWYANPISRDQFAGFQPVEGWEFWLLKITIPSVVAECALWVLAWAISIPVNVSPDAASWWWWTEAAVFASPFAIAGSAIFKARLQLKMDWGHWMLISMLLALSAAFGLCSFGNALAGPWVHSHISSILNTYREMHWESGLSLVPTWLLFLLAVLVWSSHASNGAAVLRGAPPIPTFAGTNLRISQDRADVILKVGRPLPDPRIVKWLWIAWALPAVTLFLAHFNFGPFKEITTLESDWITFLTRGTAAALSALILFDILQFLWLWDHLQGLLRALEREPFKRSFITIRDFDWRSLWSFTGVSFQSRRALNSALIDSLLNLTGRLTGFEDLHSEAIKLKDIRDYYNTCDLDHLRWAVYLNDRDILFGILSRAGDRLASYIEDTRNAPVAVMISADIEALQRVLECQCRGDGGRWSDEEEELARLPQSRQDVEKFLCLMYIGFIQTVVARLHALLISVASMFSLMALGIAIYPFVPVVPLLIVGSALLILIAWAFFKVFSQMDTNPILSRIVNGDDKRLQGNFYFKFAEAMALPLLTAGSSLLPGGAGRLLDLVQTLFNHSQ
jgi:hypothetical protein